MPNISLPSKSHFLSKATSCNGFVQDQAIILTSCLSICVIKSRFQSGVICILKGVCHLIASSFQYHQSSAAFVWRKNCWKSNTWNYKAHLDHLYIHSLHELRIFMFFCSVYWVSFALILYSLIIWVLNLYIGFNYMF